MYFLIKPSDTIIWIDDFFVKTFCFRQQRGWSLFTIKIKAVLFFKFGTTFATKFNHFYKSVETSPKLPLIS